MLKIDNNPFAKGFRENGLSYKKRKLDATGECIIRMVYGLSEPMAHPRILFRGGRSTNSVEDRENGGLGAVAL